VPKIADCSFRSTARSAITPLQVTGTPKLLPVFRCYQMTDLFFINDNDTIATLFPASLGYFQTHLALANPGVLFPQNS